MLFFLRHKQQEGESVKVKASLEGCIKEQKHQLESLLQAFKEVFHEPRGIPPRREVEHEI